MRVSLSSCLITLFAALGTITGCAHPPKVSTSLSLKRKAAETATVILVIKNLENSPTTPLLVSLSAEVRTEDGWGKPQPVLHPAAFVLNRNEQQTFTADLKTGTGIIRTMLTVKEAETGNVLKTERGQLTLPAT